MASRDDLQNILTGVDGQGYRAYKEIEGLLISGRFNFILIMPRATPSQPLPG